MCDRLQDAIEKRRNQAIIIPRDHFKSSLGLGAVLWAFTRRAIEGDYEWRTLIDSATMTLSEKHIGFIGRTLSANQTYRKVFGDFYGKGKGFSSREIFVKQRKGEGIHREPNFMASAIRAEKTGLHFDYQWYDDLTTERNWATKHLRQTAIDHFYNSLNLLEPTGIVLITATCWHDGDYVGVLRREEETRREKGEKPFIDFYVRAALENEKGEPDDENGEAIFPERWPTKLLREKKRTSPRYIWRAQQMNDPSIPEHALPFNREFMYKARSEFPQLRLITVTVDPNFRMQDEAAGDPAAIVVGGFDKNATWYGLDVRIGTWSPSDFIDQLFDVYVTWKPHLFRIEQKFTSFLDYSIRQEGIKRGMLLPVVWLKRDWRSKDTRHAALYAPFAGNRLFFNRDIPAPVKAQMEEQMERVGTSKNDDFLDALTDQFTDIFPTTSMADAPEPMRPTMPVTPNGLNGTTFMRADALESLAEEEEWPEN